MVCKSILLEGKLKGMMWAHEVEDYEEQEQEEEAGDGDGDDVDVDDDDEVLEYSDFRVRSDD